MVIPVQQSGATKKQAQTKKTGAKTQKKTQGQPESDSSDGSDLEIEAPDEPSPIPPTRPTEPIAAAEYDTLQAVWSPRNKWPSADKIKGALVDFKDVIKVLRDAWKDQVQAMKLAENQGDNDKAAKLKQETALQRRVMDKIVVTTLSMGHPTIVEKYAFPILNFISLVSSPGRGCHGHRFLKQIEIITHVNTLSWTWIKSQLIWLKIRASVMCSTLYTSNNVCPGHMKMLDQDWPEASSSQSLQIPCNKLSAEPKKLVAPNDGQSMPA